MSEPAPYRRARVRHHAGSVDQPHHCLVEVGEERGPVRTDAMMAWFRGPGNRFAQESLITHTRLIGWAAPELASPNRPNSGASQRPCSPGALGLFLQHSAERFLDLVLHR